MINVYRRDGGFIVSVAVSEQCELNEKLSSSFDLSLKDTEINCFSAGLLNIAQHSLKKFCKRTTNKKNTVI